MTSIEPTTATPVWLDLDKLCSPELRAEVDEVVAAIERHLADIQPTLTRAGELLGLFEVQSHRAKRIIAERVVDEDAPIGETGAEGVAFLVDAVTGARRLHNALSALSEASEPESSLLYAAVAMPGHLPVGVPVLVDTPDGVQRVTPMCPVGGGAEKTWRTFAYDSGATDLVITHDQLIDGIIRAQAEALPVDVDLAEANAEGDF